MKVFTDITTLSKVYPLFKEAGIEGILTGDLSKMQDVGYSDVCGKLLEHGLLPEVCAIITRSDNYMDDDSVYEIAWEQCKLKQSMDVVVSFFLDMSEEHGWCARPLAANVTTATSSSNIAT